MLASAARCNQYFLLDVTTSLHSLSLHDTCSNPSKHERLIAVAHVAVFSAMQQLITPREKHAQGWLPLGPYSAAVAAQVLPSELFQAHTAVEYVLSQPVVAPPAFVFVVDVAGNAADLEVRCIIKVLQVIGIWHSVQGRGVKDEAQSDSERAIVRTRAGGMHFKHLRSKPPCVDCVLVLSVVGSEGGNQAGAAAAPRVCAGGAHHLRLHGAWWVVI